MNRGKWHHFKYLQNCIVCNRETLIFHSVLGFWFIFQNDIVPYLFCRGRVCDGIRLEYVSKFDVDIFGYGRKPFQVEKHDNSLLIHTVYCLRRRLRIGALKEPSNGFFLHGCVSDPKAGIIHNHHKVSLLCPCGYWSAILVRTCCATLRWNTL
jgi:hypothetical protein